MLRDCKYRLPCGRCDKYDKFCEAIQYEILKQEQEKNLKSTECKHDWVLINSYTNSAGTNKTYKCAKCDAIKLVDGSGSIYESGEWQP